MKDKHNELPNASMSIDSIVCNAGIKCFGKVISNEESQKKVPNTNTLQKQKLYKQEKLHKTTHRSNKEQKR